MPIVTASTLVSPTAAIAGWALRTPLGDSADAVIDRMLTGERAAQPNARFDASTYACTLAASLDGTPTPHRILRRMGRFGADAATEALAQSNVEPGHRLALFCGVGGLRAHWDEFLGALAFQDADLRDGWRRGLSRLHPFWMLKHLSNNTQAELARTLGAVGDGANFGGANAGATALMAAIDCLADGAADAALVVAYDSLIEPETIVALAASGAVATCDLDGLAAPSGAAANGAIPGEAAAAIVLRRVESGRADARIQATAGAGLDALGCVAHFAQDADFIDGSAASRRALDDDERTRLAPFVEPATPMIATQAGLGHLGAATAVVQSILLARMLERGVCPAIPSLHTAAPGPLRPLIQSMDHAATCAVGLSVAAPGLAAAVRVSRSQA